jgi:hypothetical protein
MSFFNSWEVAMQRKLCTFVWCWLLTATVLLLLGAEDLAAQDSKPVPTEAADAVLSQDTVPRLIQFNGVLEDSMGKPLTGVVGISFGIYREQSGGAPLWLETQNVPLDAEGRYTALLGNASKEGLPLVFQHGGVPLAGRTGEPPGRSRATARAAGERALCA